MGSYMKVLITGYAGFLGRHLARKLKENGYVVRVLMHRTTVTRIDFNNEADEVIWGSFDSPDIIKQAINGVEIVIHSGLAPSPSDSKRPTLNEGGTEVLFKESVEAGVKSFVFLSSIAVYGMSADAKTSINESSPTATGKDLVIYPSEKINSEQFLQSNDKKNIKVGIFRSGILFDEVRKPIRKVIKIGGLNFGIGLGNGKNRLPFIHAEDVSDAVVKWLNNGNNSVLLNVVPSICMKVKEWYRSVGRVHGFKVYPIFIRIVFVRLGYFGLKMLKKILGKQSKGDINYAIKCATRDIGYSNEALKETLDWTDKETSKYWRQE